MMEWVETTGRSVDDAKEKALDRLGVAADDAEFEVLEEPKQGLFGRTRGEARVRARVRPTQARQKVDRRRRSGRGTDGDSGNGSEADGAQRASGGQTRGQRRGQPGGQERQQRSGEGGGSSGRSSKGQQRSAPAEPRRSSAAAAAEQGEHSVDAQQVGDEARRFMDGLLAAFGADGTVELVQEGDDLEVRVHGENLGLMVGPRGTTLQAVQDLARVAAQRRLGDHDTRLRVDIGGYRERRREALGRFAVQMADEVKSSGIARVLEPMSSADRKIIHDTLAGVDGIATRSEGDDPNRRVVIAPAGAPND
jgi:spoIIIJ-associated protein